VPDNGAFTPQSKIRDVLARLADRGRGLLFEHGYDVGEGFVDVLSQYQTLQHAAETERLRDLDGLLAELNSTR
jgi:basic membrane lipoprotein Med (substrate-binding protein (PBP1-ABC) superfamily)